MDHQLERIKRKHRRHARKHIWRRLNAYFDALLGYIHKDRPSFESKMMRHPEMKELFFVK